MVPGQNPTQAPDGAYAIMSNTKHTFTIGKREYRCHGLLPLEQIHCFRQLAPLVVGALRPADGRTALLARLTRLTGLASALPGDEGDDAPVTADDPAVAAAFDIASGILEAAAELDEEAVNKLVEKVVSKVFVVTDNGAPMPVWYKNHKIAHYPDIDGFVLIEITARYLAAEFSGKITEYILSLNLKPGPAFAAVMAGGSAPQAPGGQR